MDPSPLLVHEPGSIRQRQIRAMRGMETELMTVLISIDEAWIKTTKKMKSLIKFQVFLCLKSCEISAAAD